MEQIILYNQQSRQKVPVSQLIYVHNLTAQLLTPVVDTTTWTTRYCIKFRLVWHICQCLKPNPTSIFLYIYKSSVSIYKTSIAPELRRWVCLILRNTSLSMDHTIATLLIFSFIPFLFGPFFSLLLFSFTSLPLSSTPPSSCSWVRLWFLILGLFLLWFMLCFTLVLIIKLVLLLLCSVLLVGCFLVLSQIIWASLWLGRYY